MIDLTDKIIIFNRDHLTDPGAQEEWEAEMYPEELEGLTEDEKTRMFYDDFEANLDSEKELLDKELPGNNVIVAYGWNGRWYGSVSGMPEFPPKWSDVPAYNIRCIFEMEDPYDGACWYIDEDDCPEGQDVHFWRPEHDSISGTGFVFRVMDADIAHELREGYIEPEGEEWFYENTESLAPYIFEIWGR